MNKQLKNGRIMFNNLIGKGFIANRKHKRRYWLQSVDCFYMIHLGLRSVYIEKGSPLRNLGSSFGN